MKSNRYGILDVTENVMIYYNLRRNKYEKTKDNKNNNKCK